MTLLSHNQTWYFHTDATISVQPVSDTQTPISYNK